MSNDPTHSAEADAVNARLTELEVKLSYSEDLLEQLNLTVYRQQQQIERLRRLADEAGLDPEFAQKLLAFIVTEVVRHHEQIARDAQS